MLDDEKYSESVNIAKWNIYVAALSDLTLYVFSYLINQKRLKQNDAEEVLINIMNNRKIKHRIDNYHSFPKSSNLVFIIGSVSLLL